MSDKLLKSYFFALFKRVSGIENKHVAEEIYSTIVPKTINTRFGVELRRWKDDNVKRRGQVAFRVKLNAPSDKTRHKDIPKQSKVVDKKQQRKPKSIIIPEPSKAQAKENRLRRMKVLKERRRKKFPKL